jgi:hypothetical protein
VDDVCILAISNSYAENVQLLEKALQKAASWASKHAAKFAPDKFELIHFTNPSLRLVTTTSTTTNTTGIGTSPQDDIWKSRTTRLVITACRLSFQGIQHLPSSHPQRQLNTLVYGSIST